MQIAVIGSGPSGCLVARLLALEGHDTTLIDAQGPWEKPCGGGLTARALELTGSLQNELPRQAIDRISVSFGDETSVTLKPDSPLAVLSRKQLGISLLAAAEAGGVHFAKGRVTSLDRTPSGWMIHTRRSVFEADFVVGADGATSFVRRSVSTPFSSNDLSVTLGYFIPGETGSHMKIFFLRSLEGYIWSFPRPDHLSYGLITRAEPGWTSRGKAMLSNFIEADLGSDVMLRAEFYSAPVPCLDPRSWADNTVAGDGWALIGDAAGLVDPITGEGIYYAFRSAQILANTLPDAAGYSEALKADCFVELERASRMYHRFYRGRFAGGNFRKRLVQFARRSPTIRTVLGGLIAGSQPYVGLKKRLAWSAPRVALDMVRNSGQ